MAKPPNKTQAQLGNEDSDRRRKSLATWGRTPGMYISGRAYIDGADETAAEMEAKWGVDRLRLLVPPELREKFDRQRYLFNQAIWHGELEDIRREAGRMVNAWQALDRAAVAAGAVKAKPEVWEVAGANFVYAIVRDDYDAYSVNAEGRQVVVFTLEEIARLLAAYPDIAQAKAVFPGAQITAVVRRSIDDPLDALRDSDTGLDDPIPDLTGGTA
jgi:hypothetical protein